MNLLRLAFVAITVFGTSTSSQAQPILIGCTVGLSGASQIVDVDLLTGLATNPRSTGISFLAGLTTQPSSGFVFSLSTDPSINPANSLLRIDLATGAPTIIGPVGLTAIVEGDLTFNPLNGFLYGVQTGTGAGVQRNLFRIDPLTGAGTLIGPTGTTGDLSALAFNSGGQLFSLDTIGSGNSLLHTLDPNTGLITNTLSTNLNLGSAAGLAFDPFTGVAYVADGSIGGTNALYTLDIATGALNIIGQTGVPDGLSGLTFVAVPEPSSIVLIGGALVSGAIRAKVLSFRPVRLFLGRCHVFRFGKHV